MLDGMDPKEVIAWGQHVAESQQKQQSKLDEQAARIKELEDQPQATDDAESPTGVPTAELDLGDEAFKSLATELDLPEAAVRKGFEPVLQQVVESVTQAITNQIQGLTKVVEQQGANEDQRIVSGNIARLSEFEPTLADNEELQQKLVEKTMTLAKTGGYKTPEDAFDDAFRLEIGPMKKAEPNQEVRNAKRNGTPSPGRRQPKTNPTTWDDYEARVFDKIMDGETEAAQRMKAPPRPI
jgi:hypothetical protein